VFAYNVYRSAAKGDARLDPLNSKPQTSTEFLDAGVEKGSRYYYTVRAVRIADGWKFQSAEAGPLDAVCEDVTPPDPPKDLVAVGMENGVELRWHKSEAPDTAGYFISRRRDGDEKFIQLNKAPINDDRYFDADVEYKIKYFYKLRSVDDSRPGNQSRFSNESSAAPGR
jgi:hypothetical protein